MSTMPLSLEEPSMPGAWSRVALTFTSPARAFQLPGLSRSWWAPYLLLVVFSFVMAFTVGRTVGWTTVARNNLASSPSQQARVSQLPTDQQDAQVAMIARVTRVSVYVITFITPLLIGAIIAALLLATFNFGMGAHAGYGPLFAVYMFSCLPQLIKLVLVVLLLGLGAGRDTFLLNNPLGSNPAFYLQGPGTSHALLTLLTWFDVFLIWQIVLLIIGCALVAKVTRGKAAVAVIGWFVFFMLVTTGLAAL